MKRNLAKKLIERYFYLITEGCGNDQCVNDYCASSNKCTIVLSTNDAAALAIQLFRLDATLCDQHPMKIARTTNSTSGGTLHEVTTSLACCSNTPDMCLSHDASVQLNPCTVFQKSSAHMSDLSKSLTCAQSACSQANSESNLSSFKLVSTESMAKGYKSPSITPLETMAQKQEDSSTQVCEEKVNVVSLRNTVDHVKSSEQNDSTELPISKDILLDNLDFTLLSVPDSLTYDLQDTSKAIMDSVDLTLEQLASFQTDIKCLNELDMIKLLSRFRSSEQYNALGVLYTIFSTPEALGNSFMLCPQDHKKDLPKCYNPDIISSQSMTKEKLHEMEIKKELDNNFMDKEDKASEDNCERKLDIAGLTRTYKRIMYSNNYELYKRTLAIAISSLCTKITIELKFFKSNSFHSSDKYLKDVLHSLEIIYEIPWIYDLLYVRLIAPKLVAATCALPTLEQRNLAIFWCDISSEKTLRRLLHYLQEAITFQLVSTKNKSFQDGSAVVYATKTMKILYYASIMAGQCDDDTEEIKQTEKIETKSDDILVNPYSKLKTIKTDSLAKMLKINILACHTPLIPIKLFYNKTLNELIKMDDYFKWRANEKFSFLSHSFILTPSIKSFGMLYDNRIRLNVMHPIDGKPAGCYLPIKVRREHLVQDALDYFEMITTNNLSDLKKELAVQIDNEICIDQDEVCKEFFNLIIEELLNPDFGMFVTINFGSRNPYYWFNQFSLETDKHYTLFGLIVGLAIYNNVKLNMKFPLVFYRKLLGKQCTLNDVQDWNEELYSGFKDLLKSTRDDIEKQLNRTFSVCYKDAVTGQLLHNSLVHNGNLIQINHSNKKEFVNKYVHFLLNESIKKQFNAFYRGFQIVMKDSPLKYLFWPEELEQIVCGSKLFYITDLEKNASYKMGYRCYTQVIRYFWNFVSMLPRTSQKKLLLFITGNDEAPVGGLSKLRLTIVRDGPDSNRTRQTFIENREKKTKNDMILQWFKRKKYLKNESNSPKRSKLKM